MEQKKKNNNNDTFRIKEQDTETKGRVWCKHLPVCTVNSGISATGRMFWSSFSKILPDGFEPIWLYAGPSGPLFLIFKLAILSQPHSPAWCGTHVCLSDPFDTTENLSFCAFITLRPLFHPHHPSQSAFMETVSKITPTMDLSFKYPFMTSSACKQYSLYLETSSAEAHCSSEPVGAALHFTIYPLWTAVHFQTLIQFCSSMYQFEENWMWN